MNPVEDIDRFRVRDTVIVIAGQPMAGKSESELEKALYYATHRCCPKCGGDKNSQTYAGYIYTGDDFEDHNVVNCVCGWAGYVHDLKPSANTLRYAESQVNPDHYGTIFATREEKITALSDVLRRAKLMTDFSDALSKKLAAASAKRGKPDDWHNTDWESEWRAGLLSHIEKGDPVDVAAYCAFGWYHGWSTARQAVQSFKCPTCGVSHDRGPINGKNVFRCLKCGTVARQGPLEVAIVSCRCELRDRQWDMLTGKCRTCGSPYPRPDGPK